MAIPFPESDGADAEATTIGVAWHKLVEDSPASRRGHNNRRRAENSPDKLVEDSTGAAKIFKVELNQVMPADRELVSTLTTSTTPPSADDSTTPDFWDDG